MIFVNKGIETGTHALTLEIIADTCGGDIARAATFIVGRLASLLGLAWFTVISLVPHSPRKVSRACLCFCRPTHFGLVVRRQPTSVSVASLTESQAEKTCQVFHQPWFHW